MHNAQCIIKEGESQTSTNTTTWAKIKKKLCILGRAKRQSRAMNYELLIKFWWLWYPYRWYSALKGLWLVITGTSTSSVTKTEEKKTSPRPSSKGEGDCK